MLAVQLAGLLDGDPEGTGEALALVDGFDDALVHGLARLSEERAEAPAALAGAFSATPIGDRLAEAAAKVASGSITEEHLTALAGGRAALFGAVHDALLADLDAALGRERAPWYPAPRSEQDTAANLLGGARSWLRELAITGWRGVDHDLVSAVDQITEGLTVVPGLRRLAVLLDGFAAELRASCPVGTMEHLPVRRWADLWTRALLLAQDGVLPGEPRPVATVSGRLLILGVDVHEHGTAVQFQVHAVLEPADGGQARLVRTSVTAAKVDTIVGPALWKLAHDHKVLLAALAGHLSLEVTDLPLLDGGDVIWHDDRASLGKPADPFTTARLHLAGVLAPAVPPLERVPVRIAEPVLIEGYEVTGDGSFDLGGSVLAVDTARLPGCGPLTPKLVAGSSACVGLVRWDGGCWLLQPLAVQAKVKRETVAVGTGDWAQGPTDPKVVKAEARSGDAVAVLRERAGRLLRQ
ncbi:hypothetical protein DI270_000465 [Microbispora triticiradicis]|uniref:SWIM zinc finger family protein n=1 Tax=Microbispora triticiradicis TaxID=2200763 RepID=A0ABX9LTX5_9ACTN|nr:hypothetical protein [Microbispora triticiradicis]RGA06973.1 hypothetical protein DI270_000465 [Microbispora triticiradicis]